MMSRRIFRASLAALCVGALAFTSRAWADDATFTDPAGDGAGGHPDIVSAAVSHAGPGLLDHTITAAGAFATPEAPCLNLRTVYPGDDDYSLCGDGEIHRLSDDTVAGTATVSRPDGATIVYRFAWADLDAATAYEWRAESRASDCPHGRCDVAPNNLTLHALQTTYERWATKFLKEENAKTCEANRIALIAWLTNEGTAAVYNPLATTYAMPNSTKFNSTGVRNYLSLSQGLDAARLTLERGWDKYGYGPIVKRLRRCASSMRTAEAVRASQWCHGCSDGKYVTGLVGPVRRSYEEYASRLISTYASVGNAPMPASPTDTQPMRSGVGASPAT